MRILALDTRGYPSLFREHPIVKENPAFNIESVIISKINKYNPKLKIKGIIYNDLNLTFGSDFGKFFGLILELLDINSEFKHLNETINFDGKTYYYKIFGYIFMSSNTEETRNALFSQKLFPELISILEISQETQNFEISNKPIYLINLISSSITALSILQEIEMMKLAGIKFVNVFNNGIDDIEMSKSLKEFSQKYLKGSLEDVYEYRPDTNEYILKLDKLESGVLFENNKYKFNGSSEKFYWIGALCITKFAYDLGLKLDISIVHVFRNKYVNEINCSKKFIRTNILFNYLEKLSKGKGYFNV